VLVWESGLHDLCGEIAHTGFGGAGMLSTGEVRRLGLALEYLMHSCVIFCRTRGVNWCLIPQALACP
jgi:hypothetical protein